MKHICYATQKTIAGRFQPVKRSNAFAYWKPLRSNKSFATELECQEFIASLLNPVQFVVYYVGTFEEKKS